MGGTLTGVTSLGMSGALTGVTTLAASSTVTLTNENAITLSKAGVQNIAKTGSGNLQISSDANVKVESVTFNGGAVTGVTGLALSGPLVLNGVDVGNAIAVLQGQNISSTGNSATGGSLTSVTTLDASSTVSVAGADAILLDGIGIQSVRKSGSGNLRISAIDNVEIEDVSFNSGSVSLDGPLFVNGTDIASNLRSIGEKLLAIPDTDSLEGDIAQMRVEVNKLKQEVETMEQLQEQLNELKQELEQMSIPIVKRECLAGDAGTSGQTTSPAPAPHGRRLADTTAPCAGEDGLLRLNSAHTCRAEVATAIITTFFLIIII
jgi:hypothetical protein